MHCLRENKDAGILWKELWRCLVELKISIPYDPATPCAPRYSFDQLLHMAQRDMSQKVPGSTAHTRRLEITKFINKRKTK